MKLMLVLFVFAGLAGCVATPSSTTTTTTTTQRQSTTVPAANTQSTADRIDTSGW